MTCGSLDACGCLFSLLVAALPRRLRSGLALLDLALWPCPWAWPSLPLLACCTHRFSSSWEDRDHVTGLFAFVEMDTAVVDRNYITVRLFVFGDHHCVWGTMFGVVLPLLGSFCLLCSSRSTFREGLRVRHNSDVCVSWVSSSSRWALRWHVSSLELLRVFSSFASTETRQAVSLDEANAAPRVDVLLQSFQCKSSFRNFSRLAQVWGAPKMLVVGLARVLGWTLNSRVSRTLKKRSSTCSSHQSSPAPLQSWCESFCCDECLLRAFGKSFQWCANSSDIGFTN